MDKKEFKKKCNNIVDNVKKILNRPILTRSQKKYDRYFITAKRNFKV